MDTVCLIDFTIEDDMYVVTDVESDIKAKGETMRIASDNLRKLLEQYYDDDNIIMDIAGLYD